MNCNRKSTPPPPHKSFYSNYLAFSLLLATVFFYSCDPPSSSAPPTYTTTISGKITSPAGNPIAAKVWASTDTANKVTAGADGNYSLTVKHPGTFQIIADSDNYKQSAPETIKTTSPTHSLNITLQYITTVSGKITSPAGNPIAAKVWASTDTANKVTAGADGNYNLTVKHPGTFQIIADLDNYKASDPKTIETNKQTHNLDISLEYGRTATVWGLVFMAISLRSDPVYANGATVTVEVEGVQVGDKVDIGSSGTYRLENIAHPGSLTLKVNPPKGTTFKSLSHPVSPVPDELEYNLVLMP